MKSQIFKLNYLYDWFVLNIVKSKPLRIGNIVMNYIKLKVG